MSAIVHLTYPTLAKWERTKGKKLRNLKDAEPYLKNVIMEGEMRKLFPPNMYSQGDILFVGVGLHLNENGNPTREYNFELRDGITGVDELARLRRRYNNLDVDRNQAYIRFYKKDAVYRGAIRIVLGTPLISIGAARGKDDLIYLAQQMESLVKDVYKKNIGQKERKGKQFTFQVNVVRTNNAEKAVIEQASETDSGQE